MTYIEVITEIIKNVRSRITDQTDLTWTSYNNSSKLISDLNIDIKKLENGNLEVLDKLNLYFAPTGLFQEISIPNGWKEDFVTMANQFDQLYGLIKASTGE